jgi:FRG domain
MCERCKDFLTACIGNLVAWDSSAIELQATWCFRGHRETEWLLLTSLDRAVRRDINEVHGTRHVVGHSHLDRDEESIKYRSQFQVGVTRCTSKPPADSDSGSWFALMQHYGTPTRFLDWTSSPYVAAYFALEKEAQEAPKRSAIWAIDLDWLQEAALESLRKKGWTLRDDGAVARALWENRLLDECRQAVIIKMNPLEPNDRLVAQQGILLCKLLQEAPFFGILMRMMIYPELARHPVVRKIEIETRHRAAFLAKLRAMNIYKESLFPSVRHSSAKTSAP